MEVKTMEKILSLTLTREEVVELAAICQLLDILFNNEKLRDLIDEKCSFLDWPAMLSFMQSFFEKTENLII
jgi:hypothetical protein